MKTRIYRIHPFSALKFHDFRLLWFGLLISRIGSEMQSVAVNWQIYLLTKNALSLGLIGLSRFIPIIIFSLLGGMAADIINRKHLMTIAQIAMIFFSLILAVTTWSGHISPLLIYLLIAGNAVAASFDTPARQSIVPFLVPKKYFMNAVSLNTILWQAATVVGPALGGFVIAFWGVGTVYFINALSFLAVILALLAIKSPLQKFSSEVSFNLHSILAGLAFVKNTPIIYSTMILDFFASFFASATVLMPIFAKDIFAVGPKGLGILYAAPSLGAILAGIIISSFGHIRHQGKILLTSIFIYGLATICFGLSRSFYLSLIFLAVSGMGDAISTILRNTIRQLKTPDHLRGRMVSVNMIFFMGGPQLGEAEAGILAAAVGTPVSVVIGGLGTIAATVILTILVPKLRKYHGDEIIA